MGDPTVWISEFLSNWPWLVVIVGIAAAAVLLPWLIRRIVHTPKHTLTDAGGFTLDELQTMHSQGLISKSEFDRLRKVLLADMDLAAKKR